MMQWCWLSDYNMRPSASLLKEVLSSPSIPHLIDSVSLGALEAVTCTCCCPLFITNQEDSTFFDWETTQTFQASSNTLTPNHEDDKQHQQFLEASGAKNVLTPPPMKHTHVAIGDMFQEVWVASYDPSKFPSAQLHIIGFQGKTKHYVHVSCICTSCSAAESAGCSSQQYFCQTLHTHTHTHTYLHIQYVHVRK